MHPHEGTRHLFLSLLFTTPCTLVLHALGTCTGEHAVMPAPLPAGARDTAAHRRRQQPQRGRRAVPLRGQDSARRAGDHEGEQERSGAVLPGLGQPLLRFAQHRASHHRPGVVSRHACGRHWSAGAACSHVP